MTSIFTELAGFIAESQADELAVKNQLGTNRDHYIAQKTSILIQEMEDNHKKILTYMKKGRKLLLEEMKNLPNPEKEHHARELMIAMARLSHPLEIEQVAAEICWQKFLGLSNETLIWIYQLGYRFFDNKSHEEALSLFLMLPMLNPLVCDYWIALGFAQKELSLTTEALTSFSTAACVDANNPTPLYQCAELYIQLGQFDEALLELEDFKQLIEKNNLNSLTPLFETLLSKAQNKQSF